MAEVFVVEVDSEDFDRPTFVCVAKSLKAAVEAVKAEYPKPYDVEWSEVVDTKVGQEKADRRWTLEGKFHFVLHYTTEHTAQFHIKPQDVAG